MYVIKMLQDIGFNPADNKVGNFIKVLNEKKEYDYIPIDAKCIGRYRSNSVRSLNIINKQKNKGHFDFYKGRYIDDSLS